MQAGRRDTLVVIETFTATRNARNDEVRSWVEHCTEWAAFRWGSADERINAAAVSGAQSATVTLLSNPATRAITPAAYRLTSAGQVWNIVGVSTIDRGTVQLTVQRDAP